MSDQHQNAAPHENGIGNEGERSVRVFSAILIGALFATAALTFLYLFWFRGALSERSEEWGIAGDYIGGVGGTILGAATLVAVFLTVLLQREILLLTRQQLADTKRELELTRQESQKSAAALTRQTFENTFFRMVEQFREETASAWHLGQQGPGAFEANCQELTYQYQTRIAIDTAPSQMDLQAVFEAPYASGRHWLGPYFRTLHHILRFVDQTVFDSNPDLNRRAQDHYTSLLTAKLSGTELVLLYFYCLSSAGDKLKPYVERYGLLQHLDETHDIKQRYAGLEKCHRAHYRPIAFEAYEERIFWLKASPDGSLPIKRPPEVP